MTLLAAHLWIGYAVALLAILAVWQLPGRRIALYAVTLQILVGIVLVMQGLKAPWFHYAAAVLAWVGYMAANGMARRSAAARTILLITGVSTLLILAAFYIGQHAVKAG